MLVDSVLGTASLIADFFRRVTNELGVDEFQRYLECIKDPQTMYVVDFDRVFVGPNGTVPLATLRLLKKIRKRRINVVAVSNLSMAEVDTKCDNKDVFKKTYGNVDDGDKSATIKCILSQAEKRGLRVFLMAGENLICTMATVLVGTQHCGWCYDNFDDRHTELPDDDPNGYSDLDGFLSAILLHSVLSL